jgi:hypothetical protein
VGEFGRRDILASNRVSATPPHSANFCKLVVQAEVGHSRKQSRVGAHLRQNPPYRGNGEPAGIAWRGCCDGVSRVFDPLARRDGENVRTRVKFVADKISNLRSILASPPADWDFQRKKEYFEWSKLVVDGLTAPNLRMTGAVKR